MNLEDTKKEFNEKYDELKLGSCLDIKIVTDKETEEENIEVSFKDTSNCAPLKEEYQKILDTALFGGETIYKTFKGLKPVSEEEEEEEEEQE